VQNTSAGCLRASMINQSIYGSREPPANNSYVVIDFDNSSGLVIEVDDLLTPITRPDELSTSITRPNKILTYITRPDELLRSISRPDELSTSHTRPDDLSRSITWCELFGGGSRLPVFHSQSVCKKTRSFAVVGHSGSGHRTCVKCVSWRTKMLGTRRLCFYTHTKLLQPIGEEVYV